MELWFTGTNAGMPIADRNVTSIVLRLAETRGEFWMFDCGEATQHRLLRTPLRITRLEKLFVTHLHGDHVFGIPGLLSSRSSLGATGPLQIYGPSGIRELIDSWMGITETHLGYPLSVCENTEGIVFEDGDYSVRCAKLDHRIECYGYRVEEKPRAGALLVDRLEREGIPPGPLYGQLKSGLDVELKDGRIIRSADVRGPAIPGRIVAVLGDTRPCAGAVRLSERADVLVHEATFGGNLADKAELYGHSTAEQAALTAREAGVSRLLLTHFSSRYGAEDIAELVQEARTLHPNTDAAVELTPYAIARARNES
jgi:ribonuclease Z